MGHVVLTGGGWIPLTQPVSGVPFTSGGPSVVLSGPVPQVAGSMSIFYSDRVGRRTGRVQSGVVAPADGDFLLSLGCELPGVFSPHDVGDEIDASQTADREGRARVAVVIEMRPPDRMPMVFGAPPMALTDAGTLSFSVGDVETVVTLDAADFANIAAATAPELAAVIDRDLPDTTVVVGRDGRVIVTPTAVGRFGEMLITGGTEVAASGVSVLAWRMTLSVDGLTAVRVMRPGRDRRLSDVSLPLASAAASPTFSVTLDLTDTEGVVVAGGRYEIEVPGAWVDSMTLADPGEIFLGNRDPEPEEVQVPDDTLISLDVCSSGSPIVPASVVVWVGVNGVEVTAFDAGVFQPGWDGPDSNASVIVPELYRVVIDPTTDLPSLAIVTVRVSAQTAAGDTLNAIYEFLVEDLTPPASISAMGSTKSTVDVTFNEPVDDSALAVENYSIERVSVPAVLPVVTGATRLAQDVVRLEFDTTLTFGAVYRLTASGVNDVWGNVAGDLTTEFKAFDPLLPRREMNLYRDLIPQVNRDLDVSGDLRRFLDSLQDTLDLLLCLVDEFARILDVDTAPPQFLDAMLADLGNPFDFDLSENDKRKLVRILVAIYGQKGTGPGIVNTVRFFVGVEIDFLLYGQDGWILDVSELGEDTVLFSGDVADLYSFSIVSEVALTDEQRDRIVTIALYMKPAHTHLVSVIEPEIPVEPDHLELGLSQLDLNWSLH